MKTFSEFIKESVVDIPKNSLDPDVFDFFDDRLPVLKTGIKYQIAKDVDAIEEYIRIRKFNIVGSILTRQYTKNSDIDVTIEVNEKDSNDMLESKVVKFVHKLNGKLAVGTTHPINYYIYVSDDELDPYKYDAIYDVINDKWIKQPKNLEVNVENYLSKFHSMVTRADLVTAKLRRDIIDFSELKNLGTDEIKSLQHKLKSKFYDISRDIEVLIDFKKIVAKKREDGYSRPLSPDEIEKYRSRNNLPENVVYKLLEKYYYWDFIQRLEDILGEDKKLDTKDIKDVLNASKDFMAESYTTDTVGKKTVAIFGLVDDETGEMLLYKGDTSQAHGRFDFSSIRRGRHFDELLVFRYIPTTQTIYWWEVLPPSETILNMVIEKIMSLSPTYKVTIPFKSMFPKENFKQAHTQKYWHPKERTPSYDKDVENRTLAIEGFRIGQFKSPVIFGMVTEDGVFLKKGDTTQTHGDHNLVALHSDLFRYLPKTKTIYWWGVPSKHTIQNAIERLHGFGYSVTNPNVNLMDRNSSTGYDVSHGFKKPDVEKRKLATEGYLPHRPQKDEEMLFGVVNSVGTTKLRRGTAKDVHLDFDFYDYGEDQDDYASFRYSPITKTIYWWIAKPPATHVLNSVLEEFKKSGYPVEVPYVSMLEKENFRQSHSKNHYYGTDAEEGMNPTHEGISFKDFMLIETEELEKAKEKTLVKLPETPSMEIRNRQDMKAIPKYKQIDPNRELVNRFLKPYLAKPTFNPTKLGLIKLSSGQIVNVADMLVDAFPPMNRLTDENPSKILGNTGITIYKIGQNYYMKKG